MENKDTIKKNLAHFHGSENIYKNPGWRFKYTEGVRYLINAAECYWLLDLININQNKIDKDEFQSWTLERTGDSIFSLVGQSEDGYGTIKEFEIGDIWSDFPLDKIKFFYRNGVLMLPSEY